MSLPTPRIIAIVISIALFAELTACRAPTRVYLSPAARQAQQRPRTVAILPLELTAAVEGPTNNPAYEQPRSTSEAAMLQQMLYSTLLQQARRKTLTVRNVERHQLPADSTLLPGALAQRMSVESVLVSRIYRTRRVIPGVASTVTVHNEAVATTTSTGPAASAYDEVMLDLALYDQQGQLLWKYNNRASTHLGYATVGGLTERLVEDGLKSFPFAK